MTTRKGEVGRIGQKRYGGVFYEEFLPELRGRRGMAAYSEMAANDDLVGAILYAIKMLIRQVDWNVAPGGASEKDQEAADFVLECMADMQDTWTDTISEILSFLTFGWSAHEIVYKRRCGSSRDPRLNSKYSDSLVGWMKLPIRSQESLYQWEYDENDNLIAMTQMPPPNFELITIPAEKLLFFRTESSKATRKAAASCATPTVPGISNGESRKLKALALNATLRAFLCLPRRKARTFGTRTTRKWSQS